MQGLVGSITLIEYGDCVDDGWLLSILKALKYPVNKRSFEKIHEQVEGLLLVVTNDAIAAIEDVRQRGVGIPFAVCSESLGQNNSILVQSFDATIRPMPVEDALSALLQLQLMNSQLSNPDMHAIWRNTIIGDSSIMQETVGMANKIANIDCDVLIQGETGTGKELIARLIHYQSNRQDFPFVPVNCGAFNDDLLLSELFGHIKGAFTGATQTRAGLIEQAQGGTLFLDEIDSLSPKAQVALLRYLQDREVRPQGGNKLLLCDTRVVAASNAKLKRKVEKGEFREDLLFRLDVLRIDLPPLRERGNDIHLLAQFFMRQAAEKYQHSPKVFSLNFLRSMEHYQWPGNIRQLQNVVTRLLLLSDRFVIRMANASKLTGVDWSKYLLPDTHFSLTNSMQSEKQRVVEAFEVGYLNQVLRKTNGNVSEAAALSQKERRSFIRLMQKYHIKREDFLQR